MVAGKKALIVLCILALVSPAYAEECTEAHNIKAGEVAPCSGILMPEDMAKELYADSKLYDMCVRDVIACYDMLRECQEDFESLDTEPSNSIDLDWLTPVIATLLFLLGGGIGFAVGATL